MGKKTTTNENPLQKEVKPDSPVTEVAGLLKALTSIQADPASMPNRATTAFLLSIVSAVYQMISLYIATLVDRNTSLYFYTIGYETLFLTSFIAFWSASHILEDWKGRITWPSIILGLGVANLSTIILAYYAQISQAQNFSTVPSLWAILALITGPILMMLGGILGFSAVRQYSREQGHAVIGHA
jgi:hypothetical protein